MDATVATESEIIQKAVQEQLLLDQYAREDFLWFRDYVMKMPNGQHHIDWGMLLMNKAYQEGDVIIFGPPDDPNNRMMIFAPRNHAKSTVISVQYPLWRIGNNPNIRIVICSASASISTSFLREIKGHLEQNEDYKRVFGNIVPKHPIKWTDSEIIVERTRYDLKDPTVSATSAGGTVLSKRADILICDDILNEGNTHTHDQREKIKEWFNTTLMPVLEPNGQVIVVGTAWNMEDLYHHLLKDPTYQVKIKYRAVMNWETGEILWPERWSIKALTTLKLSMGSISFNRAYQNEAITDETRTFKENWIQWAIKKGRDRTFLTNMDYASWDMGQMTIAMGVDLAISQRDESDFTAIAVVGRNPQGVKIPLFIDRRKMTFGETQQYIIELYNRFMPGIVIVENNGYQAALQKDLAEKTDIPIRGYSTGGEKFDPDIGLNSIAVEMENEKWIFPYADRDPHAKNMIDYLTDGMRKFPSGHTEDTLMALWFANTGLRTLATNSTTAVVEDMDIFG